MNYIPTSCIAISRNVKEIINLNLIFIGNTLSTVSFISSQCIYKHTKTTATRITQSAASQIVTVKLLTLFWMVILPAWEPPNLPH